jgi:integrase
MASLQERNGSFRYIFRFHGKQHFVTLGKVSSEEADAKAAQVEYLLLRLKQRLIELPAGIGIVEFLQHDGNPATGLPHAPADSRDLTLSDFRDRYLATHRNSLEERTIEGIELHFKHLTAALGEQFPIRELSFADLQAYVDRRSKAKGMGNKRVSAATIKKEIVTLRTAWNWADKMALVAGRFPYHGLRYPKSDEKPPFQTITEIERRLAAGGLKLAEQRELWECLYLRTPEIAELLAYARDHAAHPWIYPLVCMAGHTGARRSELLRMLVSDVDFDAGSVVIREKKRVKGKRSTRRAPLTPLLKAALRAWLAVHPGGNTLFCHADEVARSKKRSRTTGHQSGPDRSRTLPGRQASVTDRPKPTAIVPLTPSECHHHFRRTFRGSKWQVVRGLHVLRHSVASCLAAAGVDQRIIDDILGHQSLEMQRRYRHLTPQVKSQAVLAVFGE